MSNELGSEPRLAPKLLPVIVIGVPGPPVVGVILLMLGLDSTVNGDPLLEVPFTVTTTFPVPILVGIGTTIELALQLLGARETLNKPVSSR